MTQMGTPRRAGTRRGFRARPRATDRSRTPHGAAPPVRRSRRTPVTSHSWQVSMIRVSKGLVDSDPASAHGPGPASRHRLDKPCGAAGRARRSGARRGLGAATPGPACDRPPERAPGPPHRGTGRPGSPRHPPRRARPPRPRSPASPAKAGQSSGAWRTARYRPRHGPLSAGDDTAERAPVPTRYPQMLGGPTLRPEAPECKAAASQRHGTGQGKRRRTGREVSFLALATSDVSVSLYRPIQRPR